MAKTPTTTENDRLVLEYLRQRGFKKVEQVLLQQISTTSDKNPQIAQPIDLAIDQAQIDDDLRNVLMMLRNPGELADSDVRRFEDSYCEFRDWVDGSLDMYKPQLHALLYPLLVHCFLEMVRRDHWKEARAFLSKCSPQFCNGAPADGLAVRRNEIISLLAVASPQHLEENEIANLYLSHRYEIYLSQYAFELILSFLADDPRRSVLLRILNQRCRLRCEPLVDGQTATASGLSKESSDGRRKVIGIVADDERNGPPSGEILWGRLRPEMYIIPDEDEPKPPAKAKGKEKDKSKSADPKSKADPIALKKDSGADDDEEIGVREDGTISVSRVPLKRYRFGAPGLTTLADLKARAKLRVADCVDGIRKDLSILFYTFTNLKDDGLNCSAVSEDGAQIAAGFGDSSVRIWDARAVGTAGSEAGGLDGRPSRLIGHTGPVYSVDWSTCTRFLVSGSEDGFVRLWSAPLKTGIVAYRGHNFPVWSVAFSPLDHYFASGSHDRTARLWTSDRTYPLRIFAGHLADVDVVRWHPNCNYIATGSSDRTTRLWDLRDGNCVRVLHSDGDVHALAFSPDGRTLACGGDSPVIDIWDIASGKRVKELKGHRSTVWSLDYSQEGAVLASGGADWRVCTWRAEDWSTSVNFDESALANGIAGGNGNGEGMDGDGDARMTDGEGDAQTDRDGGQAQAVRSESERVELMARSAESGVPACEAFPTKDTPVQLVKFTRRNLLIATGTFGT